MANWVPFLSALAGGGFALAGAVIGQLMTKRREFVLDERRAARVRADAAADRNRELFLQVAEYAQNYESKLEVYEDGVTASVVSTPAELVHRDLLNARVRTLNHPQLRVAWDALILADGYVNSVWRNGNFDVHPDTGNSYIDSDEFYMLASHIAVEAVVLAATAALGPEQDAQLFNGPVTALAGQVQQAFDEVHAAKTDRRAVEKATARRLRAALHVSRALTMSGSLTARTAAEITAEIGAAIDTAVGDVDKTH